MQSAARFDRGVAICSDGLGSSEDPVMATPEPRQLVRSVQETARASGQASAESERHARDRASERHARDREEESGRAEDEETQRGGNERGSADVAEREGESLACSMAESVLARQEDALGSGSTGTSEEEREKGREMARLGRHEDRKETIGNMGMWGRLPIETNRSKSTMEAKGSLWQAASMHLPLQSGQESEGVNTATAQGERERAGGPNRREKKNRDATPYEKKKRYCTKELLHLIGCPSNHVTANIRPRNATGKTTRRYVCGHPHCVRERGTDERKRTFTQKHPGIMEAEGTRYENRKPKWAQVREGPRDIERPKPKERKSGKERECVGDTRIAFNNPGGLGEEQKSLRWGRRMMEVADIVIGAECNQDATAQEDFTRAAYWDPHTRAQVLHAGYHRKGTGMVVMISERVHATEVRQRQVRNAQLQLIVVDLTINNIPHRIVGGHAPAAADLRKKRDYYERVAAALQEIRREDDANPFAKRRVKIWGQDRNLTLDDLDQLKPLSRTGARWVELVDAINEASAVIGEGMDSVDTFRALHPKAQEFTHGSRRLDTVEVSEDLCQPGELPRMIRSEHVDREKIAILLPQKLKGWHKWLPEHKAVVITIRYREEEKAKPTWQYRNTRYPNEVWQAAVAAAAQQVERRVEAKCEAVGGRVKLTMRKTTAEERHQGWQQQVKETLQGYEKRERKRKGKEVSKLTAERDRWKKIAERVLIYKEDKPRRAEAEARMRKCDVKLRAIEVRKEMVREQDLQRALWHPGSEGNRTLYDMVRTKARGGDLMKMRNANGEEVTATEGIREIVDTHYDDTFNLHRKAEAGEDKEARRQAMNEILQEVRDHRKKQGGDVFGGLSVESILEGKNIEKAIRSVRKGTVPAEDGFGTSWYATGRVKGIMVGHLQALFRECVKNGELTEAMKTAIISVLHKGKGKDPEVMKSYRPVSITPSEYRILTRAIQQKLQGVCAQLIGRGQVGYLGKDRQARDNTMLFTGMLNDLQQEGKGGVVVQLDNSAAFDRVRWDFMGELLEAFGFPADIRELIEAMYNGIGFRTRVNGKVGERKEASNGVRQGCGASPLLYILVQEALLISLRGERKLKGLHVGQGRNRAHAREFGEKLVRKGEGRVLERCLADDTMVYLRNVDEVPKLFEILRKYELASGQALNASKSVAVLVGEAKHQCRPCNAEITYAVYGEEEIEESLGITAAEKEALHEQMEARHAKVRKEATEKIKYVRQEMGVSARIKVATVMFASKLPYCDGIQVPRDGETILSATQRALDEVVFGERGKAWHFVARETAMQEKGNGGLDQVDVEARAEAEWASHVTAMLGETDSWKEMWWEELRKVYGPLAGKQLLQGTCAFRLFQGSESATEVQRRGLKVWGQLKAPEEE